MKTILKNKKGVAGLNMYLSLIAMLFMIGIIVMVFQIAGAELFDAVADNDNEADNLTDAQQVINDTRDSIKSAIDWFPTFIVLGALVVLILLVVIIINSIRQTGLVQEGA